MYIMAKAFQNSSMSITNRTRNFTEEWNVNNNLILERILVPTIKSNQNNYYNQLQSLNLGCLDEFFVRFLKIL